MSAQWMLYALAVGLVVTVAALAAEQGTRLGRHAGRWVWIVAALLSIGLPVLAPQGATSPVPLSAPSVTPAPVPTMVLGGFPATPAVIQPAWRPARQTQGIDIDKLARWGWGFSSALALAVLASATLMLRRRQRSWTPGTLCGVPVLVSPDAGPAVVGVLRPRIVVPPWLLTAPASRQTLVMAHEQAHIAAGDQRLLAVMTWLLVAMPWNLALWCQLRQLRLAIEIDCDARVLAQGHRLAEYGAALIEAASHTPRTLARFAPMTPAVAVLAGFLERRLRLMTRRPARWHRVVAPVLLLLSLDIGAVAARIAPPPRAVDPRAAIVPQPVRQALAGYHQFEGNRVAVVAASTNGLEMTTNGEPLWRLRPESADQYFLPGTGLRVRFDRSGGTLTVSHQGFDMPPAPRTDATAVERADAYVAARRASGQPLPGGEGIVRRNVGASDPAQLHADDFTPGFLRVAQAAMPRQRMLNAAYGQVQAVAFDGVNRWGWDRYHVRYANRTVTWAIWLDADGRLAGAAQDDSQRPAGVTLP